MATNEYKTPFYKKSCVNIARFQHFVRIVNGLKTEKVWALKNGHVFWHSLFSKKFATNYNLFLIVHNKHCFYLISLKILYI